jgi:hypothetical protein
MEEDGGGVWWPALAQNWWRWAAHGRRAARRRGRGGEGGGAPGAWAVMGQLAWADLNEQ